METIVLFRPVGVAEMLLVEASGFRGFPPRLPEQPIFYPVCNEAYAVEIAARWNTGADGGGFVTRFAVRADHLAKYERHIVGARHHEEYWIPAEELDAFNAAIVGTIAIVRAFAPTTRERDARWGAFARYVHLLESQSTIAGREGGPHRCPCCHCLTLAERGGFEICPVCFWEDDGQDDPDADVVRGGPNNVLSLAAARANYQRIGACEERMLAHVRPPLPEEK